MKFAGGVVLASLTVLFVSVGSWVYFDYQAWYDLGPSTVPHNFDGWMQVTSWRFLQAKDPLDTSVFEPLLGASGDLKSLEDLPERMGVRPVVDPHPGPHRQMSQYSDRDARAVLRITFDRVVARNSKVVYWGPSHAETNNDGVLLRQPEQSNPTIVQTHLWGEVGHIHPIDGSVHLVLSPSDAKKVMDMKWGELHRMAGIRVPQTYMLIYAPRNIDEIAQVEKMLDAAIRYSTLKPAAVAQ